MLSRLKSLWVGERGGAGDTHIAYPDKNEGGGGVCRQEDDREEEKRIDV